MKNKTEKETTMIKHMVRLIGILLLLGFIVGCESDASVASYNLSKAADMFEVDRRIVFYNGITGDYMLVVEGRCSIKADTADNQLEVTCKTGPTDYKKHFLGLSDNVTYFAEQITSKNASVFHYRVIFKPDVIVPDIDLSTNIGR